MARKETQKVKAEKLDALRKIFVETYLIQLNDDTYDKFGAFSYKTLFDGNDISNASEFNEEVALVFSGEDIHDILKILEVQ